MRGYGLIGYPLTVSFSKAYFTEKFLREGRDAEYSLYPLSSIADFGALLSSRSDWGGLNVTIPYKKSVMSFLDEIDEAAQLVGAVNVIKCLPDGRLRGYNSDVYGFEESFRPLLAPHHRTALVLGTGGAAAAVYAALQHLGIPYRKVSRTPATADMLSYAQLHKDGFGEANILINTTPLGMSPQEDTCPDLPYDRIGADFYAYDLVYTPATTLFLEKAHAQGAVVKNGLEMLHLQAERAWDIWNS